MTRFYSGMKGPVAIEKLNELWAAADTVINSASIIEADIAAVEDAASRATEAANMVELTSTELFTHINNMSNAVDTASNSALSASSSADTATQAALDATSSKVEAYSSASTATSAATSATISALNAAASATGAHNLASLASTAADTATARAIDASNNATLAINAATSVGSLVSYASDLFDQFNTIYLGIKSLTPLVDNDGNMLIPGLIYFNSIDNNTYVYTSTSTWASISNLASLSSAQTLAALAASSSALAFSYKNLAQNWAEKDTEVEPGKYSAKYWAGQAASSITGQLVYRGIWLALSGIYPPSPNTGDYYRVGTPGEVSSVIYNINNSIIYNGTLWDKIGSTNDITSVSGKTGVVVLEKADVGLSNVDNTSDELKPVSAAVYTALTGKANSVHLHDISLVNGLQLALEGKQLVGSYSIEGHTHTVSNIEGLSLELNGKAALLHLHSITSIQGLEASLLGKADINNPTYTGTLQGEHINVSAGASIHGPILLGIQNINALDIDCSMGNYFTKSINTNSTFTFSNVPADMAYGFTLELTHTSGIVAWPTSVVWPNGTAPTLTTGKVHLFFFVTDNGGTKWRGGSAINYAS